MFFTSEVEAINLVVNQTYNRWGNETNLHRLTLIFHPQLIELGELMAVLSRHGNCQLLSFDAIDTDLTALPVHVALPLIAMLFKERDDA